MDDYYLEKSDKKTKKYMVSYINKDTGRINTIQFGQAGASDFTQHKNKVRRDKYEARHSGMGENWNNPKSGAGFWSYHLLWNPNTSNFKQAIKETEKKFNINIHYIE